MNKDTYKTKDQLIAELRDLRDQNLQLLRQYDFVNQGQEKAALESSLNAVAFMDLDYRFFYVNEAFLALWEYTSKKEVLGKSALDFWSDPGEARRVVQELQSSKKWSGELEAVTRQGKKLWFRVVAHVVSDVSGDSDYMMASFIDVTEWVKAEHELRASEGKLCAMLQAIGDHMSMMDRELNILWANDVAKGIFGEDIVGEKCYRVFHGREKPCEPYPCLTLKAFRDNRTHRHETVVQCPDGKNLDYACTANVALYDPNGEPSAVIETSRDISREKQAVRDLRESEERFRQVYENTAVGIAQVSLDFRIECANQAYCRMLGYEEEELIGRHVNEITQSDEAGEILRWQFQLAAGEIDHYRMERSFIHKSGRIVQGLLDANLIRDENRNPSYLIGSIVEITEFKQMQEKLKKRGLFDLLTHLYSRNFFEEEMKRMQDGRYAPIGIIICDLDGLKFINDTLGHDSGNAMLKAAAEVLKSAFRSSDIIARIGGDEFAVLLPDSEKEDVIECCSRLKQELEEYNQASELGLFLSIGYAVEDNIPVDMNKLFKKADDCMYKEKILQKRISMGNTVAAMYRSMEVRDQFDNGHADRLKKNMHLLGNQLGLPKIKLEHLGLLSRYHDVGKVGVSDGILFKPGALTQEEYREVKRHCQIGQRIALAISELFPIADYILKHHEWWDGTGYPVGVQGEDIPLESRIMSIVDAYDIMTSERAYKQPMSREDAVRELERCAGSQFDPHLVKKFLSILE